MKKLVTVILLLIGCIANAGIDVYDFKLSAEVPVLKNGYRIYKNHTYKGNMYIEYNDDTFEYTDCYVEMTDVSTKDYHKIDLSNMIANRIGKPGKYTLNSIPTFYSQGTELETTSDYQSFDTITLSGNGCIKTLKSEKCGFCGGTTIEYCMIIEKLSGRATGLLNSLCPDDEDWTHTLKSTRCDVTDERDTIAPFHGTWSAKWNKKLSTKWDE